MTVRELIEHLQTLDPDKGIWIFYDYPCDAFEPYPDGTATSEAEDFFKEEGVRQGDYVITAG